MSFSTWVARRYMAADKSNRFFSWISILSIFGVGIGVAAMIVVWSVINGFEDELRRRFLISNAHILLYRFPSGIEYYEDWSKNISADFKDEMTGIAPFVYHETMARNGMHMAAAHIRGTDPVARATVQDLRPIVTPQSALDFLNKDAIVESQFPPVIVGKGLLETLNLKVKEVLYLVKPDAGDMAQMTGFRIVGSYESGLNHYDGRTVLMRLDTAQKFFEMGDRITGLEIGLHDPWDSAAIAAEMESRYTLSVRQWQSLNRPLFEAMQMERVVILLITALVAGVAGFNILTTIFVNVSQRQRDISIIKSLGASNGQILRLFLVQGTWIGFIGCIGGAAGGFGLAKLLERYQFVDLPDLYLLTKVPVSYEWQVYLMVCAVSFAISILAGVYPAYKASRLNPVDGFRLGQDSST